MVFIQISNRIFNINIHRLTNFAYIYIWNFLLKLHIHRKVFYKIRKKYKSSEIELYLESNNLEKIYTTSPTRLDTGYILFQTDTGNYLCGNESSFLDDKKFKNITKYKKLEDMYKLKTFDKTVSDNWVRDLSEFRFLGLINFFKNINEINNAQSISDSFRQQRTAKTNKLVVEVKKRIYNKIYESQ